MGSFGAKELWMRWEQAMRCTGWADTIAVSGYRVLGPIPASVSSSNKMIVRHIFSLL